MIAMLLSLLRPSKTQQKPEMALIRGLAHAVAGTAIASVFGPITGVILYALIKEVAIDWWLQGGDPVDCGFDVANVAAGALEAYVGWWKWVALATALAHAAFVDKVRAEPQGDLSEIFDLW